MQSKSAFSISQGDRFIPSRREMDLDVAHFNLMRDSAKENAFNSHLDIVSPTKEEYKKQLAGSLLQVDQNREHCKILAFKNKAPAPPEGYENPMRVLYTQNAAGARPARKAFRHIPSVSDSLPVLFKVSACIYRCVVG
jgi:cell division cycle protein 20 (cofactor of APC complex)